MSGSAITVLLIGLEPEIQKQIEDLLQYAQVRTQAMDIEQILEPLAVTPILVISGPPAGLSGEELAQTLRMQYQETPIYLCCQAREGFERKKFLKNGFTDAFLFPLDLSTLRNTISETLAIASKGAVRVYRPVKLLDVEEGAILDFETSLFLPANKRFVRLSEAGASIDQIKLEKIRNAKFTSLQVPVEQIQKFYDYSAKRLKLMGEGSGLSATERKEKLHAAVRELISGLFTEQAASFESGQAILKDCGEIVKSYIADSPEGAWFSRIQQVLGDRGDQYSHTGNVSTLAALFSMGLGIGKPEDMALAGLLHDIGIAELPIEIQTREVSEMNAEQLKIYHTHPERSLKLIQSRKMVISETVTRAILEHHEHYNGTGFPKGIFGDRLSKEAQILAIADHFDYLTRVKEGRALLTPAQAVEFLRKAQVNDPSQIHYSPELLAHLLNLFPKAVMHESISA